MSSLVQYCGIPQMLVVVFFSVVYFADCMILNVHGLSLSIYLYETCNN